MRYLPALLLSLLLAIAPALAQNGSPAGSGGAPLNSPTFTGTPTSPTAAAGTNTTQLSTTAFVTTAVANAIAGVNPAVAVQAATTQASDTSGLTYNNGVAGVGATFTGSVNTAFAVDGFTFTALNQRVLIKNDTQSPSGAFNGIYYVTQLQTAILPPILTRALDYDQPSDMNNTGAIPVVNGTVNGTTSWLLTSAIATVGTDPLTFTKFSVNPNVALPVANGGTGASTAAGAQGNLGVGLVSSQRLTLVNFNAANGTDIAHLVVNLPTGASGWLINGVRIFNCTAAITTAHFGLFDAPGATGNAITANTAGTVTATGPAAANSQQSLVQTAGSSWYNSTDIYLNLITQQGSAVTCSVTFLLLII